MSTEFQREIMYAARPPVYVFVRVPVLHVIVWVCSAVCSIRRGPSLIESLRGWMSFWFTLSCSFLYCD